MCEREGWHRANPAPANKIARIATVEAAINIDVTPNPATHTHRIGRTGRVDAASWAFSLLSLEEMG